MLNVPPHVASQRQQELIVRQQISSLRIQVSSAIFVRLADAKYVNYCQAMIRKAIHESDPFGVNRESVEAEPVSVAVEVDVNPEAAFSIHAANAFLHHLGLLDAEQKLTQKDTDEQVANSTNGQIITDVN